MHQTLLQITELLQIPCKSEEILITGMRALRDAGASELSFFDNAGHIEDLKSTHAVAVLMTARHLSDLPEGTLPLIVDDPYLSMAYVTALFYTPPSTDTGLPDTGEGCRIAPSAAFGKNVLLGDHVTIMAGCYLGDHVTIGDGTVLYPNVTIYHGCSVGSECILHAGSVIGADGYGFVRDSRGQAVKIYQNGNVMLGDRVEVGANSTIDRAVFSSTVIREGSKIDNLVHIAHNCDIGESCLIAGQSGIAGSAVLKRGITMGAQGGIIGHVEVGEGAILASRVGVTKSLTGGKVYGGFPAIEQKLWLKMQATLLRLVKRK